MRWMLVVCPLAAACGKVPTTADARGPADAPRPADAREPDAAPLPDAAPSMFTNAGSWSCASGVDCEDVYDFDITGSGTFSAAITQVTGDSVPRLELFAGQTAGGTNLFGDSSAPICGTTDTDLAATPVTVSAGHYRLAAGRDWGESAGADGTYTITVMYAGAFTADSQTADDVASMLGHCP